MKISAASTLAQAWGPAGHRIVADLAPSHRIDDAYLLRMRPLAERCLREAAMRWAILFDRALDLR